MCERVTIIETLEKMNSNLERIATALERAYPPAISIAQEEMTGDMRPQLKRPVPTKEYYDIIKRRWESKHPCPKCGHDIVVYRDEKKATVEFKCDKCGLERSTHLPWYAPWEADE